MIWFVHVSFIFYYNLYPDVPSMKVYSKSMKNMDFPICFKICFNEKEKDRFKRLGYNYDKMFFGAKIISTKVLLVGLVIQEMALFSILLKVCKL